jgi:hypothetical protein
MFLCAVNIRNTRGYDAVNEQIARVAKDPGDRVLQTFQLVCTCRASFDPSRIEGPFQRWLSRMENNSPLHLSAHSILLAGTDTKGPCGSLCRSMIVLLRRAGFEVRKAILYAPEGEGVHTVVEVKLDGEWRVFDPTYAWFWKRPSDGEIATAEDLGRDTGLLAAVLEADPNYPLDRYVYTNVHHLRWEKIPGLPAVRWLLAHVLGEERVRAIGTPYIYERPYLLTGFAGMGTGLLLLGLGVLARWGGRSPQRPAILGGGSRPATRERWTGVAL